MQERLPSPRFHFFLQSNKFGDGGDCGIYVGSIMKGGAVALDGRIEPGDMILQVNDRSFENMSNNDAVRVLFGECVPLNSFPPSIPPPNHVVISIPHWSRCRVYVGFQHKEHKYFHPNWFLFKIRNTSNLLCFDHTTRRCHLLGSGYAKKEEWKD